MTDPRSDADDGALLPCPFCGGKAIEHTVEEEGINCGGQYIDCASCGCSTNLMFPLKDAVDRELREQWNRRSPPSTSEEREIEFDDGGHCNVHGKFQCEACKAAKFAPVSESAAQEPQWHNHLQRMVYPLTEKPDLRKYFAPNGGAETSRGDTAKLLDEYDEALSEAYDDQLPGSVAKAATRRAGEIRGRILAAIRSNGGTNDEVQRDAERYRWLRRRFVVKEQLGSAAFYSTDFTLWAARPIDAAIDAEMRRTSQEQPK